MTAESRCSGGSNSVQSKFRAFTLLCIHLCWASGSTSQILFFFSVLFFFPFRLLALTKGCKGAEPRSWQDTFLFPCGFVFPSFLSGSLGNCAAFPVKSQPLPQDHTACYILTYFWSPLRTCFTMIPVPRAFILSFTHICESVMMLYLSVVCNNDQLHIFGCPLRLPFMLRGKRQFNICWFSYLKLSHFLFKKRQAGRGGRGQHWPHIPTVTHYFLPACKQTKTYCVHRMYEGIFKSS